jgi:cell wall-associated NlpC family hydrolase
MKAKGRVAAAESKLDTVNVQLEILVERWNGAQAAVAEANNQLIATQAAEAFAVARVRFAQIDVDRLAQRSYQIGPELSGGMGQWVAVLDGIARSGGISDLTDRTSDLSYVGAATRKTMTDATVRRAEAAQARALTSRALADVQVKQATAADALATMRTRQQSQKAELARLNVMLTQAQESLASAQRAAASLARQRTAGLAAAARLARARELARVRARQHASSGASGIGTGGSRNNGDRRDPSSYIGRYPQGVSHTSVQQRLGALAYARAHIGDPYIAGRDGPHAFDCSGLTSAGYRSVGWSMIHFSQSQFLAGEKIPLADLQPGDLVFYATDPADWHTIHHVVFYSGPGMMVEAPHTGAVVRERSIYPEGLVPFGARP